MAQPTTGDRIAIIALTSPMGLAPGEIDTIVPLTLREWNRLAAALDRVGLGPAALLEQSSITFAALRDCDPALLVRIEQLLSRSDRAERATRELEERGIWVATTGEPGYPRQWSQKLGLAPSLVYGDGSPENVDLPAIGIVGSRDISERLTSTANDLGAKAVLGDYAVVSGGARGTDRSGMDGALEVGGAVIGILPDHLQRERLRRPNREAIDTGKLTMISVVHPDTPFAVGNAMYRNRLIYALSELTIVVSTSDGTGGTWAGAIANLKQRWAPLAVWIGDFAPVANHRLVELGAVPLAAVLRSSDEVRAFVHDASAAFEMKPAVPGNRQLGFFHE